MPFAVKNSFVYLVIAAFFIYVNPSPAHPAGALSEALGEIASLMEELKMSVTDEEGKVLDVRDFRSKAPKSFILHTPASERHLAIQVKVGELRASGFSYSLVARESGSGKVFSRRNLTFSPGSDAESVRLKILQTSRNMQLEIVKKGENTLSTATVWTKYRLAFQTLFGIPEARALDTTSTIGAISLLALLVAGVLAVLTVTAFSLDLILGIKSPNPRLAELAVASLIAALFSGATALIATSLTRLPRPELDE